MELEKSCGKCGRTVSGQERLVGWLYGHAAGRVFLRPLIHPWFSRLGGRILETRLSALAVKPYVRANHIDLTGCQKTRFTSFNDFFTRELAAQARPVDMEREAWISPCDSRLTVYPVGGRGSFTIKHTPYTVDSLLENRALARRYEGGLVWLYRLCVDDYHRYLYPENGRKSENVFIPGVFHTVHPIAGEAEPIYRKNTREYCVIQTEACGTIVMMEVGAMLVGRIENRETGEAAVRRGQEKGNFAFGGSTIVVLTQAGRVAPFETILQNSQNGIETRVRMGEAVGQICHAQAAGS